MATSQTENVTTNSVTTEAAKAPRAGSTAKRPASPKPAAATEGRQTKQAILIGLLQRPDGATIAELVKATGWQNHSIRGAISFALKKKLGLNVTSQRDETRGRIYRIAKPTKPSGSRTKKRS
ncbi:MAG: DUF3489 domain-containing protein [Rhodospirillales bacterium]|nr:DUF3489 domain-containing protein [Rhodospirillales bacterium]